MVIIEEILKVVDKRIKDSTEIERILKSIEKNPVAKEEFYIQQKIQDVLYCRFSKRKAPAHLLNQIQLQIQNDFKLHSN